MHTTQGILQMQPHACTPGVNDSVGSLNEHFYVPLNTPSVIYFLCGFELFAGILTPLFVAYYAILHVRLL
jgi:hypothetical protein